MAVGEGGSVGRTSERERGTGGVREAACWRRETARLQKRSCCVVVGVDLARGRTEIGKRCWMAARRTETGWGRPRRARSEDVCPSFPDTGKTRSRRPRVSVISRTSNIVGSWIMMALSFVCDSCRFGGGRASSSSVLTRLRFLETTSCCDGCVVVVAAVVVDRVVLAMSRTRRRQKILR